MGDRCENKGCIFLKGQFVLESVVKVSVLCYASHTHTHTHTTHSVVFGVSAAIMKRAELSFTKV